MKPSKLVNFIGNVIGIIGLTVLAFPLVCIVIGLCFLSIKLVIEAFNIMMI